MKEAWLYCVGVCMHARSLEKDSDVLIPICIHLLIQTVKGLCQHIVLMHGKLLGYLFKEKSNYCGECLKWFSVRTESSFSFTCNHLCILINS